MKDWNLQSPNRKSQGREIGAHTWSAPIFLTSVSSINPLRFRFENISPSLTLLLPSNKMCIFSIIDENVKLRQNSVHRGLTYLVIRYFIKSDTFWENGFLLDLKILLENPILHIKKLAIILFFLCITCNKHHTFHIGNFTLGEDPVFRIWEKI